MKKLLHILLTFVFPICLIAAINNQPEIKLPAAKDRLIPIKQRTFILQAAEAYLNRSDEVFVAEITSVDNPYSSGVVESVVEEPEEITVVYDDASILELIQANFAPQVRGTMAKGDTYYLQLNGGGMLKKGDQFPVQIPQIEGESYVVSVLEITPDGYTLKMNDVVRGVVFEKTSGIIKNSAK